MTKPSTLQSLLIHLALTGLLMQAGACASTARFYSTASAGSDRNFESYDGLAAGLVAQDAAPMDAKTASAVRLIAYDYDAPSDTRPTKDAAQRIVIYNASYRVVVADVEASIDATEKLADLFGGYVQTIRGEEITIRVPAAKYAEAIAEVEALGRVSHREQEALDVTEEYVDLQARLRNAKSVRTRLEALLAKAEDVKAALEVEKELKRLGEEIERYEAQLEVLQNRVAFSTITVTFERVYRAAPTPTLMRLPFDWLRELTPQRLMNN